MISKQCDSCNRELKESRGIPDYIRDTEMTIQTSKNGYKRYKAWCHGCDRRLVAGGKKCPVCGVRQVNKKLNLPVKL